MPTSPEVTDWGGKDLASFQCNAEEVNAFKAWVPWVMVIVLLYKYTTAVVKVIIIEIA